MRKILIVDDEDEILELVGSRLEANDFEVLIANDGQEAIETVKQENPDLILMDIMMPKMPGGDAVRVLQSDDQYCNIPIIFLTAVTSSSNPVGHEENGINVAGKLYPAIGKPFDPEVLLALINKNLS